MTKLAILTISDSRNLKSDSSGKFIEEAAQVNHLEVVTRKIVKDDLVKIQAAFLELELLKPDIIITNGGTGYAQKDFTIAAIKPLLSQTIEGFGELFRQISYQEIGTRALASKAMAGFNYYQQLVYCLPGSNNACKTGMQKLILPDYQHLLFEKSDLRKKIHNHAN